MIIIYYLLAAFIIVIDQWSKWIIVKSMMIGESIPILSNVLYLTSSRNKGAAWSILEGKQIFFFIITVIVVVVVIYYLQKMGRYNPLLGTALGLVLGGSLGNFIDRVFRGQVVDFIHVFIGNYSYPIFNVADSSLCIGVILILIYTFLEGKKEKRNEHN